MRVLISGGGVGGLTLAYWLRKHGMEPVIIERSSHGRLGGYGIDLIGTGYDVATRMGLVDRLLAEQLPVDSVDFIGEGGHRYARLTGGLLDKVIRGPHVGLMHTTLEEALHDAVRDDVEIRFDGTIVGVREIDDGIEADLSDGGTERFDLLVGADGIHSVTRELAFGPEAEFARYLGCHLATYMVPDRYDLGRVRLHYTQPGRQVVVYPTDETGTLGALFIFKAPPTGPVPRERRLDALRTIFGGTGWITPSLLADAPASEEIFMDTMTQIVMPTWHRGRVALIGDACGAMTMVSAQGVSMAMGGAYLLAEALATEFDHVHAFRRYQQRMQGEVTRRQRNALVFARTLVPAGRIGLIVQRLMSRIIMREAFAPVLRRQFGVDTILPDDTTIDAKG